MTAPTSRRDDLEQVDVALVMESTYPYGKGGLSAVVHDIVVSNPDLTFGVVHLTWDSSSPAEDIYGAPANVRWVTPVYLSMAEHEVDFLRLRPRALRMRAGARRRLAHRLYDALEAVTQGDPAPLWELYDEGMNPRTRSYPLWALLGSKEFMAVTEERLAGLGLPLVDTFWLLRDFFSLGCAVLSADVPRARVYHSHTAGYAGLLAAAGARQNGGTFVLTEHNLYVRDTINLMLERSMAIPVVESDWRTADVTPTQRAWMAWWIEMGRFCYPSAEVVTYLFPEAIGEAARLGAPADRSVVIPNGMVVDSFDDTYRRRLQRLSRMRATPEEGWTWRLACIARVVPIKGVLDLIDCAAELVRRGITDFELDVLGPTDPFPEYYQECLARVRERGLEGRVTFRGTVRIADVLDDYDALVLTSYNEGQPMVVLEAMLAGLPTAGTRVGGMAQLVEAPLTTPDGRTWGACGVLQAPGDVEAMADTLQTLMRDRDMYLSLASNARGRVEDFFRLEDAMAAYNRLYREAGGLPVPGADVRVSLDDVLDPLQPWRGPLPRQSTVGRARARSDLSRRIVDLTRDGLERATARLRS